MRTKINHLTCSHCGINFETSKRADTKYCSEKCKLFVKASSTNNAERYLKHKDKIKARRKLYYAKVKGSEEYRAKARAAYWKYSRDRMQKDVNYLLKKRLRTRLHTALKKDSKVGSAVNDLGCSIPEFRRYLESKFQPGMSWDNWSKAGWHIDHIVPLCKFNLTNPEQFKQACHYTNLQPLWAKDNLVKSNK